MQRWFQIAMLVSAMAMASVWMGCDTPRRGGRSDRNNGTNNGVTNNATNNGATNNGVTNNGTSNNGTDPDCAVVCDQFGFCDIAMDDCAATCEATLTLAEVRCVVDASSCNAVVACIDDGGECESPDACGGCGPLQGAIGAPCGMCGSLGCEGGRLQCLGEHAPNACGGCEGLAAVPGARCQGCGVWACQGADDLECALEGPVNACGGCGPLTGRPGDPCGDCGQLACRDGGLFCVNVATNACGGCGPLEGEPGTPCGTCGQWSCQGVDVVCQDAQTNACGGCAALEGNVGEPCGCGGRWACSGTDLVCGGDGGNGCGGCETLPYPPNAACDCGGRFVCLTDGSGTCDDGDNFIEDATPLPDTSDGLNMFIEVREVVDARDSDWYRIHVTDTPIAIYDTEFILTPPPGHDLDLCAYYVHDDTNLSPNARCAGNGVDTALTANGVTYEGCCQRTRGTAAEDVRVTWSTDFLADDTGTAFIAVERVSGPMECAEYSLQYQF